MRGGEADPEESVGEPNGGARHGELMQYKNGSLATRDEIVLQERNLWQFLGVKTEKGNVAVGEDVFLPL